MCDSVLIKELLLYKSLEKKMYEENLVIDNVYEEIKIGDGDLNKFLEN